MLKCNPKAILPTLCTMFNFILESKIFPRFRKNLKSKDGLSILTTIIEKYEKQGQKIFLCFVNFEKIYDNLPSDLLFIKLVSQRLKGNFEFLLKTCTQTAGMQ